ncbi:ABC transporter permease [Terrisporobacter vanillatitrophus]
MKNRSKKKKIVSISLNNLKHKKVRSLFLVLFVIIQSFSLFTSTFLMSSMRNGIENVTQRMGADVIVIPNEYSKELEQSLFMGEPSTMYFDREWTDKLSSIKNIDKMSTQFYIQTMEATCCDAPVQLIAFDPDTDFVIKPWLKEGNINLKKGEVVVGHNVASKPGDIITFYNTKFNVVDKLDKTGTGNDNTVFMSYETAYELKNSKTANDNLKLNNMENTISMVLLDVNDEYSNERLAFDINTTFDEENITAYTSNSLFSGIINKVKQFSVYSTVFSVLLFIVTAMAIICIFIITINERKKEIGILYTIGAKKKQISLMIMLEGLIITTIGSIIGVLCSLTLITLFKNLISMSMDIPYLNTFNIETLRIGIMCLAISIFTGLIASIISVYKISREDTDILIRENE